MKAYVDLIASAKPCIDEIKEDRKDNASNFNVFSALGVVRKEVIQSRFLAYLLSPKQSHDQGTSFLKAFLDKLGIQVDHMEDARVVTERSAGGELGRMDIVIDCKPSLIVIEIKIDAGEGVAQLPRYSKWLSANQLGYDDKKKHLIFLTPTGHESITGKIVEYKQFSYSDLADTFTELLGSITPPPPSVREVLRQYVVTCKSIGIGGNNMPTQDEKLWELLTEEKNIMIALEMEQQTTLARERISKEFTANVIAAIEAKITKFPNWKLAPSKSSDYAYIRIETARHGTKPNFSIYAEFLFASAPNKGKFGWITPKLVDMKLLPEEIAVLSKKMIDRYGYEPDPNQKFYLASAEIRNGLGSFSLSDNDEIVACLKDNRDANHPNATDVANEIWAMFEDYVYEIEALPTFQQNAS